MPRNNNKKTRWRVVDFSNPRNPVGSSYYSIKSIIDEYGIGVTKEAIYYHIDRYGVYEFGDYYSIVKIDYGK